MIILNFKVNINSYAEKFSEILSDVLDWLITGVIVCPKCGGHVVYNCTYPRHPLNVDGTKTDIEIIQVTCKTCKKSHSLIPDFVMPYKHYNTETIESAVSFDINESVCVADNSTIYRWKRQFLERGSKAVFKLCMILLELYQRVISAIKLNNLSLIRQLSLCVKELGAKESATTIGSVNVILSRANAGFI